MVPTSGAKIAVRCFAKLEVTELIVLLMDLSGVPPLCILGRSCMLGVVSPV